jgi:hypothetical protein
MLEDEQIVGIFYLFSKVRSSQEISIVWSMVVPIRNGTRVVLLERYDLN